jgi:magnesium transporter
MIQIRRKKLSSSEIVELSEVGSDGGVWIDVVSPSPSELEQVSAMAGIDMEVLQVALDAEELPRLEIEDGYLMAILDVPVMERDADDLLTYQTYPVGIIHTTGAIVTVSLKEHTALDRFRSGSYKGFSTVKMSRFTLQMVREIAGAYVSGLRSIDSMIGTLEHNLRKSMRNEELIQMLSLGKSLVYFSTSLKANHRVLRRMMRNTTFTTFEEDADLLEDAVLETEQAMEMADIYTNVLNSTMDALASIISNNLNAVMKVLTSAAIVLAVPTIVASWFGMNVAGIPLAGVPGGFWWVGGASLVLAGLAAVLLSRRGLF